MQPALCYFKSYWVLSQSYTELIQWLLWALLLFALMYYAHKAGTSWFPSLYKVVWVLRGLLATLALRFYIILAYLFGLYYNHIFAFDYFV